MKIILDGKAHEVDEGFTLADLLASLSLSVDAVATAVDGQFIARPLRSTTVLHEGAKVLIFQPIVGG